MKVYHKNDNEYITIDFDYDSTSPREWDNLGHMITYNKEYSPDDYDENFIDIVKRLYGSPHINKSSLLVRTEDGTKYVVLPIYIYQHSCIAYSTHSFVGRAQHAEWDSGLAGIIYASEEEIKAHLGKVSLDNSDIDVVAGIFESECEDYTAYCNGTMLKWDIYQFTDRILEWVDGCGGYVYEDDILSELGIIDLDYEEYLDVQSFELELHRKEALRHFTGGK